MRVGILQFNPHTLWRPGGGELHARKYLEYSGVSADIHTELFDPERPFDYDLIHFFGANYQMNEFGRYARLEGIRVVGTPILYPSPQVRKYRLMLRLGRMLPFPTTLNLRQELLLNADALIANSKPEADYFSAAYGAPVEKVHVLATGADDACLSYQWQTSDLGELQDFCAAPYFLMVGRVTLLKNQLEVATIAAQQGFRLLIVGKPDPGFADYAEALRTLCSGHDNLRWVEGLDAESNTLKALYSGATAHILWSDTEVAALVNNEALAYGCPVIARGLLTTKDILGDNAVYANNAAGLKDAIKEVQAWTAEKRREKIAAGRKLVREKLSWSAIVAATHNIYRQLF